MLFSIIIMIADLSVVDFGSWVCGQMRLWSGGEIGRLDECRQLDLKDQLLRPLRDNCDDGFGVQGWIPLWAFSLIE